MGIFTALKEVFSGKTKLANVPAILSVYFYCYSVLLVDYLDCRTPIPIMCNTAKIMQLGLTSAFGNILLITIHYFLEKHLESSLLFFVSKLKNNYQTWNSFC